MSEHNVSRAFEMIEIGLMAQREIKDGDRMLFLFLAHITDDPDAPLPWVYDEAAPYSPCRNFIPLPPRCYVGFATGLADKLNAPSSHVPAIRSQLKRLEAAGLIESGDCVSMTRTPVYRLIMHDDFDAAVEEAFSVWTTRNPWLKFRDDDFLNIPHLHYAATLFPRSAWDDPDVAKKLEKQGFARDPVEKRRQLAYAGWRGDIH